jgi:hypothetical protein
MTASGLEKKFEKASVHRYVKRITDLRRYSGYLLYWYKSTNTDAAARITELRRELKGNLLPGTQLTCCTSTKVQILTQRLPPPEAIAFARLAAVSNFFSPTKKTDSRPTAGLCAIETGVQVGKSEDEREAAAGAEGVGHVCVRDSVEGGVARKGRRMWEGGAFGAFEGSSDGRDRVLSERGERSGKKQRGDGEGSKERGHATGDVSKERGHATGDVTRGGPYLKGSKVSGQAKGKVTRGGGQTGLFSFFFPISAPPSVGGGGGGAGGDGCGVRGDVEAGEEAGGVDVDCGGIQK